jgi:hypothetical protein
MCKDRVDLLHERREHPCVPSTRGPHATVHTTSDHLFLPEAMERPSAGYGTAPIVLRSVLSLVSLRSPQLKLLIPTGTDPLCRNNVGTCGSPVRGVGQL